ncbi:MAG TPA: nucleotidyltransferase family protein [Kiritimatiellia bacterium]|nr:nucleotidyltransferase family protein [Kiritimatiellia bacterium]
MLSNHTAIILAAGASSRMGRPKALLAMPDGTPLAAHQARLAHEAGCVDPVVVLGADAERIAVRLDDVATAINQDWALGRLGSIQTGLRARPGYDGYLILPVDTVGVRRETLEKLLSRAEAEPRVAWRPCAIARPGRVVWISAALAEKLLTEPSADTPLDRLLAPVTSLFDVDDPAILNNINTPDAWAAVFATL